MTSTTIQNFLEEMASQLGLKRVPTHDDKQVYQICVEDTMYVNLYFWEDKESVVFFTNICEVEANKRSLLFDVAMRGNLFGLRTNGCALGYDSETNMIILSVQHSLDNLSYSDFYEYLKSFCGTAAEWVMNMLDIPTEEEESEQEKIIPPTEAEEFNGIMV